MDTRERKDDVAEFVDLLTSSQRSLFAYINSLLVGNSVAQDVLQDANLQLWARRLDYDWSRPFLPWAYGFAFQLVLAYRKKQSRSKLVFNDQIIQQLSDLWQSSALEGSVKVVALQRCMERLDPQSQQLVRQRYIGRASVTSLAEQLQANANQVSARLYRIRRALARCVEAAMLEDGRS